MSLFSRPSRSGAFFLGVALFLLVALGAFYTLRTRASAENLERRNLRQLARIGRSVEARMDNFGSILRNLGQEPGPEGRWVVASQGEIRRAAELVAGLRVTEVDVREPGTPVPRSPPAAALELAPWAPVARLSYRPPGLTLVVEIDLRERLEPLLEPTFFDHVFLADAAGRVFLQADRSGIRLQRVPGVTGEGEGGDADLAASSVREVEVVGESYKLFLQPVRLRLLRADGEEAAAGEWIVGGLVSSGRFRSESLSLHPTRLLVLSLLLVSAVLAWPFLKVWSMGSRERVEVMDVLFMGFSLLLGSGVVALALEDLVFYPGFKQTLDDQLVEVGGRLEESWGQELEDALTQLLALTEELERPGSSVRRTDLLAWEPTGGWRYPYLEMAFWADAGGGQQAKWTVRENTTPFVSVAGRGYFERVRQGRLWHRRVDGRPVAFTLESIRSVNTGEALTAFAVPYPAAGRPEWEGGVAVLLARPASFHDLLLPPGFGFAVIDSAGQVLWSSAPQRNLEENLFEETGNDELLRSVAHARKSLCLDADYLGRDIRLATRPLAGTSLTLVVFADREGLRTTNLEALLFALGLFLVYAALLVFLFLGLYLVRPTSRLRWAWPDRRRPLKHLLLMVSMLLFGVELFRQVMIYPPQVLLASAFLLPVLAVAVGLLILTCGLGEWRRQRRVGWILVGLTVAVLLGSYHWLADEGRHLALYAMPLAVVIAGVGLVILCDRSGGGSTDRSGRTFRRLYMGSILLSLVVLGMFPAALFFRAVYFEHLKLLVRHGQLTLAAGLDERWHRLSSAYAPWPQVLERRLRYDVDIAAAPFFETCFWAAREGLEGVGRCKRPAAEKLHEPRPPRVHAALAQYLPFVNDTSVATRHLFGDEAADGSWRWQALDEEDELLAFLKAKRERGLLLTIAPAADPPPYQVLSRLEKFVPSWSLTWWLLLAAAGLVLAGLVRFQSRRVFLLDLEPPRPADLAEVGRRRIEVPLLVICADSCDRSLLANRRDAFFLDLRAVSAGDGGPELPPLPDPAAKPVLCVDHADHRLGEPEWNRCLLGWLEQAHFQEGRKVVLLVRGELERSIAAAAPSGEDAAAGRERRRLQERWTTLLAPFVKLSTRSAGRPEPFAAELASRRAALEAAVAEGEEPLDGTHLRELFAVVEEECGGHPVLEAVGRRLVERSDFLRLTPRGVVDQVREGADGFYRSLWSELAAEEKLLLAQLAQGALVNPSLRQPLRRLLSQGLLLRDPALRLRNRSLRRFVEETVRPEDLRSWEQEEGASTWQQLRPTLLFSVVVVAVFLFATQRQLFDTTMGFISAVTVGLPALFKLLGMVRKQGMAPDGGG